MNTAIFILFFAVLLLIIIEDMIPRTAKLFCFVLICLAMFFTSVFKEWGCDPDFYVYEKLFYNNDDPLLEIATEPVFIQLSRIIIALGGGMGVMIFINALLSFPIKMYVLSKMSNSLFLPLIIYIPIYFELHDLIQMRASMSTAFFMFAIYLRSKNVNLGSAILGFLACITHYSALIGLPLLAIGNKKPNTALRIILATTLVIGYGLYFIHIDLFSIIPSSLVGGKVNVYQNTANADTVEMNLYTNAYFMTKFIFIFLLFYFYDFIAKRISFSPICINTMYLSVMSMFLFSTIPVVAFRFSEFLGVMDCVVFSFCLSLVHPKWLAKCSIVIIGIYMLFFNFLISQYFK